MKKTIVLASNNKHKIQEFEEMLPDYEILTLEDVGFFDDIIEDGNTFLENSLITRSGFSLEISNIEERVDWASLLARLAIAGFSFFSTPISEACFSALVGALTSSLS